MVFKQQEKGEAGDTWHYQEWCYFQKRTLWQENMKVWRETLTRKCPWCWLLEQLRWIKWNVSRGESTMNRHKDFIWFKKERNIYPCFYTSLFLSLHHGKYHLYNHHHHLHVNHGSSSWSYISPQDSLEEIALEANNISEIAPGTFFGLNHLRWEMIMIIVMIIIMIMTMIMIFALGTCCLIRWSWGWLAAMKMTKWS